MIYLVTTHQQFFNNFLSICKSSTLKVSLFLTYLSIISAISISVRFEKFNDKLKAALLISAKAIMIEHLAEAGLRYIGLISLTVPADRTENRDARNNHLALPSGTRQLAFAVQTNVIWKIAHHVFYRWIIAHCLCLFLAWFCGPILHS